MRRTILFLIATAIVTVAYFLIFEYYPRINEPRPVYYTVQIGTRNFKLEVADTEEKKVGGLAGRDNMKENEGMLFLFDKPAAYGMIMDGMKFPLDFIWLKNKSVADILPDVHIDECLYPHACYPKFDADADAVIELNAGTIAEIGLKVGDYLSW